MVKRWLPETVTASVFDAAFTVTESATDSLKIVIEIPFERVAVVSVLKVAAACAESVSPGIKPRLAMITPKTDNHFGILCNKIRDIGPC